MQTIFLAAMAAMLLSAFPGTAHAYIDPGTAGMVLQAIVGGVIGALFVVRLYWQKLKCFLLPSSKTKEPEAGQNKED
jgi:nitric oxide reductase large subunit